VPIESGMGKAERAELLRRRFKAKGGLPYVDSGKRKAVDAPRAIETYKGFGTLTVNERKVPLWAKQANPSDPVSLAERRIVRVSPLLKIAAIYPKRQPRPKVP